MNIAIIGAGNVGGALGNRLASVGHDICYGVRNPQDPKHEQLKQSFNARFATVKEAAQGAKVVMLAVPWKGLKHALSECGDLCGKIVVDCTNPIKADRSGLEIGLTDSAGETVARLAYGANVVKCFNHTGFENMANPSYPDGKLAMFAAGDDMAAVKAVSCLAREMGFDAIELEGITMARQLEQMAWLWIDMATRQGMGRNIGFALLRRDAKG